jgi:hypothetical protein
MVCSLWNTSSTLIERNGGEKPISEFVSVSAPNQPPSVSIFFSFFHIFFSYYIDLLFFRGILREHRRLPPSMRNLGDSYVRNEFKLHKKAKNEHLKQFYSAWESYLESSRQKSASFGANISSDLKEQMTEEQKLKLNDLKMETAKIRFGSDLNPARG